MLDQNYICECCGKPNCEQIEFNFNSKQWLCFTCSEKRLKAEKEAKHAIHPKMSQNRATGLVATHK